MNKKRAQAWGYDLIAGLTIFVIGIFTFFLFSLNYAAGGDSKLDELEYQGGVVGDSILSEGYPKYWSVSNFTSDQVDQLGILSDGVINQTKLDQFYQVADYSVNPSNYQKSKGIFSISDEFWINFSNYVSVKDSSNVQHLVKGIGREMSGEKNSVRVTRLVSNGTDLKTVNIFIWN